MEQGREPLIRRLEELGVVFESGYLTLNELKEIERTLGILGSYAPDTVKKDISGDMTLTEISKRLHLCKPFRLWSQVEGLVRELKGKEIVNERVKWTASSRFRREYQPTDDSVWAWKQRYISTKETEHKYIRTIKAIIQLLNLFGLPRGGNSSPNKMLKWFDQMVVKNQPLDEQEVYRKTRENLFPSIVKDARPFYPYPITNVVLVNGDITTITVQELSSMITQKQKILINGKNFTPLQIIYGRALESNVLKALLPSVPSSARLFSDRFLQQMILYVIYTNSSYNRAFHVPTYEQEVLETIESEDEYLTVFLSLYFNIRYTLTKEMIQEIALYKNATPSDILLLITPTVSVDPRSDVVYYWFGSYLVNNVMKTYPVVYKTIYRLPTILSIIDAVQTIIPPGVDPVYYMTSYMYDLFLYNSYLTNRDTRRARLPVQINLTNETLETIWNSYSDRELQDFYHFYPVSWTSSFDYRVQLERFYNQPGQQSSWFIPSSKPACSNTDRPHAIYQVERDVSDATDPILAYGSFRSYRCYNASELEGSIRVLKDESGQEIGVELFRPDWLSVQSARTLGIVLQQDEPEKYFSPQSIYQLYRLLISNPRPVFDTLTRQVREVLSVYNVLQRSLVHLAREYKRLPENEQRIIQIYLVELVLEGMYARFWKGPNHPYPYVWFENPEVTGSGLCTRVQGEANLQRQFIERRESLEAIRPELRKWILALPTLLRNPQTERYTITREPIDFYLQQSEQGGFCTADLSMKLLYTGYYLFEALTGAPNTFDSVLRGFAGITDRSVGPFEIRRFTATGHVDPHVRQAQPVQEIQFEL